MDFCKCVENRNSWRAGGYSKPFLCGVATLWHDLIYLFVNKLAPVTWPSLAQHTMRQPSWLGVEYCFFSGD